MDYRNIILEYPESSIAHLKLNRPEAFNALNMELLTELSGALTLLEANTNLRALVMTGAGKAFAAGADIEAMKAMNAREGQAFGAFGSHVFRQVELLPYPVIAAVNGYALGGGCELSLACDIRLASEKAVFGQPEVALGITPGFGGTVRLAKIVGRGIASELIFTGRRVDAQEALRIGLVNAVVPHADLEEKAMEMARGIAAQAPVAVRYSKESIRTGMESDSVSANAHESVLFGLCFATSDQKEGMAAFLAKKPNVIFKGE